MKKRKTREDFWKMRSKNYQNLEWAIKGGYLHAFLDAGEFSEQDYVLDIGSGTGIIAHTISPFVDKVIGVDISQDMLDHAFDNRTDNEEFVKMDARDMEFSDNTFTKVTARMVFHHITDGPENAMKECYRVLKPRGKMIFSEGVPPSDHVRPFYTEMFKLKEDRITFMDADLMNLMRNAGFVDIKEHVYYMRRGSIKNWLGNSGVPKENQDKIFQMHLDMDSQSKLDYNMVTENGDCFIDMKFVILVGSKL